MGIFVESVDKTSYQPVTGVLLEECRFMSSPCHTQDYIKRGATWRQGMIAKRPPGSFEIAYDAISKRDGKKVKHFTWFSSRVAFFQETALHVKRNFYEIIPEENPRCTLYFDVEHYCPSQFNDDGTLSDDKLESTIKTVQEEAMTRWPALQEQPWLLDHVIVTISSRIDGGVYKHSFHISFPRIGFEKNTGALKNFARHLQSLDVMQATNAKMEPMSLVDTSVYSRNQNLRIIESWKLKDEQPSKEMALEFHPPRPHTMEALLQTLVTNVKDVTYWIPEPQVAEKSVKQAGMKGRKREKPEQDTARHQTTASAVDLPLMIVEDAQKLLEQNGSRGCDYTGRMLSTENPISQGTLVCKNNGPRHCLATKGFIHKGSNSAYCSVRGEYIWYHCHSYRCKGRKFCLGQVPASLLEWLSKPPMSKRHRTDTNVIGNAQQDTAVKHTHATDSMDLDDTVVMQSTAHEMNTVVDISEHINTDTGSAILEWEETAETEVGQDASECEDSTNSSIECLHQHDDPVHQARGQYDPAHHPAHEIIAMRVSPIAAFPWHHITARELTELIELFSDVSSSEQAQESTETVIPILKRFGYRGFYDGWSAVRSLSQEKRDEMWSECDAGVCTEDLNAIVSMVNTRLKANTSTEFLPCHKIEKVYTDRPSLSDKNKGRITRKFNKQYLSERLLKSPSRIIVVESCTGTGKTQSIIKLARKLKMPIISVCQRITQVQQHVQAFRKAGIPTKQYDDSDVSTFQIGLHSYVTTIESLPKFRRMLQDVTDNAVEYILLLDEVHSNNFHLLFSTTLQSTRIEAALTLSWLMKHSGKVVAMDNQITDVEFAMIDTTISSGVGECEVAFIKNEYKKYTGIEVHYRDEEEMIAEMKECLKTGKGFTVPCNTKKQAERIHRLLLEDTHGSASNLRLYTSEEGILPEHINTEWSYCGVVYTPTITTGIDFNPKEAQTAYLFLKGEDTISPAVALQMINRNRNIKDVKICASGMKNHQDYASFEEMSTELDALCRSTSPSRGKTHYSRDVDILRHMQDCKINMSSDTCEYTDNGFSKLYKTALYHNNVMGSSFLYMLDGLMELRGYKVIRQSIIRRRPVDVQAVADWNAMDDMNQQAKENEFDAWLSGTPTGRKSVFEKRLAAVKGIKHSEIPTHTEHLEILRNRLFDSIQANPGNRQIIVDVFTDSIAFEHNMNLMRTVYTDEKLREIDIVNNRKDFSLNNLTNVNSKVQLMRRMIRRFNRNMPSEAQLKLYDLTLKQSTYDEDDELKISDDMWNYYKFLHKRSTKLRPRTRKALMTCIFGLSQELFGKKFTKKTKTNKAADKSKNHYNYTTDEGVLKICIEMADWSRRPLDDINPEIVQRYNLEGRKQYDKTVCIGLGIGYLEQRDAEEKTRQEALCRERIKRQQALHHENVQKQQATHDSNIKIQQELYDNKIQRQQSGHVEYVEENIIHQAEHDDKIKRQRVAHDEANTRQQIGRDKKQKTKVATQTFSPGVADQEEERFRVFLIERRKQIEQLDTTTQTWKTRNFAAWSKKELWQQERDRELSFAVYRQGHPNQHPDFH